MPFKFLRAVIKGAPFRPSDDLTPDAGRSHTALLTKQHLVGPNPGELKMFAYAPPHLPAHAPLVVILHGCSQTAAGYDAGSGWTILARELGFAVLAPQQISANNANTCFNWFEPGDGARDHGEAASIRAMIDQMVRAHRIDPAHIFITGLSAGGAMTAAMLAAYPEIFAGGAIIAGLAVGSASNIPEAFRTMRRAPENSARQWGDLVRHASAHGARNQTTWPRVSIWQGDADTIVHPGNGEELARQWTNVHGLTPSSLAVTLGENFQRRAWIGKDGRVAVELIEVAGMGHGVPVGDPSADPYGRQGAYFLNAGLSSTARIASFFGFKVRAAFAAADRRRHKTATSPAGFSCQPHSGAMPGNFGAGLGGGLSGVTDSVQSVITKSLKAAGLMKG